MGLLKPQNGPTTDQDSLKEGGGKGPTTAPIAPKSAPRAGQEDPRAAFLSLRGGSELRTPLF
eukprot:1111224-Pyramimonas_sp.AAC.1